MPRETAEELDTPDDMPTALDELLKDKDVTAQGEKEEKVKTNLKEELRKLGIGEMYEPREWNKQTVNP